MDTLETTGVEPSTDQPPRAARPLVTYAVIALCVAIFVAFNVTSQAAGTLSDALAPSNVQIWRGSIWGLVTSAFVHVAFWHLFFNMIWAREFGRLLEPDMRPLRYLGFVLMAAVVTSGWQLLVSGETGIGYSGVVYAMFGYVLARKGSHPAYQALVTPRTIQWMLGWLVLCVVLTWTGTWSIGNAAHVSGLALGYLLGGTLERPRLRRLGIAAGAVMLAGVVLACSYMPWSDAWQDRVWIAEFDKQRRSAEEGDAHSQAQLGSGLMLGPESRSQGLEWLRKSATAGDLEGMNGLAWWLAVAREDGLRNGKEAVRWAERAHQGSPTSQITDTLAAAYAESDRWDEAISTQERAIAQSATAQSTPAERKQVLDHLEAYRKHQKWRE